VNTLAVNGARLAFVDQGAGTPVVLVHGFPLDHTMWNAQIDALSEGYRAIAPDLRGFGHSGGHSGDTITMGQFADDLAGLLDGLRVSEPVVLCGLSMGGYVAFQFWQRHGSRLRGLILCDTRAGGDAPEAAAARRETAERVLREGPAPLVAQMTPKLFAQATLSRRPELVDSLREVMLRTNPKAIAAAARGMAQRPEMLSQLEQIDCPTLVIVGQEDVLTPPEEMRLIAGVVPGARMIEIAGCGHMAPIERPAETNAAMLEFLGEL
jgi:3-oxoadipate enol-lactonase